jgi:hypothetical protein
MILFNYRVRAMHKPTCEREQWEEERKKDAETD